MNLGRIWNVLALKRRRGFVFHLAHLCKKILFIVILGVSGGAIAAPSSLSYQGRILQTNGTPLEYQAVLFDFRIMDPTGHYTIYEETSNAIDMSNSGGVFDVPIGAGTKTYPDSTTADLTYSHDMTLLDAFNNDGHFYCKGSGTNANCYVPVADDARILRVQFFDGNGWKLISPDSVIRSVPFAGYSLSAQKLGTHLASEYVLKNEVNNPGSGSVSCSGGGSFLTWDAVAGKFGCEPVAGASGGTVTDVTASSPLFVTNGTSTPNITIQVASGSQNGYLSSSDWTAFNNKLAASTVFVGDVSGTASTTSVDKLKGTALSISSLSSNQVLKYSGGNWMNSTLATSDISGLSTTLSGLVAQSQFPASCAANQTLTFSSPSGSFTCSSIAINGSQVSGDIAGNATGFTGSLAGDVSGTQGATSVDKIKGVAISSTAPTNNQVLTYTGGSWTPADLPSGILSGSGTAGYVPYYNTATTLANSNIYYNGTNVGIGTTNPNISLNVLATQNSTVRPLLRLGNMGTGTNTGALIEMGYSNSSVTSAAIGSFYDSSGNRPLAFYTGTAAAAYTEKMRIDGAGNIGIGVTTPSEKLEVNGNIKGTQLCIGSDCRSSWPVPGTGTVTSVASGTGLTGGPITTSGTLAVDVGTTANKIVQLDSSAKLPAVDGSALTNLNAANLASGTLPSGRMPALTGDVTSTAGTTATTLSKIQGKTLTVTSPTSGDYLKYNGTGWINDPLSSADLSDASSLIKSSQMPANCAAGQTLTFSSPTGAWTCSNIVVTASNFGSQTQNTFLAAPNGSNGTPTFRTIASADLPSGTLSGSGTAGYVPYYSGASTLTNSNLYYTGGKVGLGTTTPAYSLDVNGFAQASRFYSSDDISSGSGANFVMNRSDNTKQAVFAVNKAGVQQFTIGENSSSDNLTFSSFTSGDFIFKGGDVGIGTASPQATAEIISAAEDVQTLRTSRAGSGYGGPNGQGLATLHGAGGNTFRSYSNPSNAKHLILDSTTDVANSAVTAGDIGIDFDLFGNTKMTLASSGNLGIGTITPSYKLHVVSSDLSGMIAKFENSLPTTSNQAGNFHGTWSTLLPNSTFDYTGALYATVNRIQTGSSQSGTITSALGAESDVYHYGSGTISSATGTSAGVLNVSTGTVTTATGVGASVQNTGGGTITNGYGVRISTIAATNKWSLYAGDATAPSYFAGSVGIGTTAPPYNLSVSSNTANGYTVISNTNLAAGGQTWRWYSSSTGASLGSNAMCFGLGMCLFEIFSSGNATLSGTLTQSSDVRLKRDIQPIENALDSVTQLDGVTYYWKNPDKEQSKQIGLIAQNVEKVFPEAVKTDAQGFKSVAYQNLVAPIINALKEIRGWMFQTDERVLTLEKDNNELKKKNAALEAYLCAKDPAAPFCQQ